MSCSESTTGPPDVTCRMTKWPEEQEDTHSPCRWGEEVVGEDELDCLGGVYSGSSHGK